MFISDNKEDKILISKALDTVNLAQVRHKPCFLGFLNERETYIINEQLSVYNYDIHFYGGYEGASRTVMCASECDVDIDDFPIVPVYFTFRVSDLLSHRDFLGALMSIGIERDCIGDIIVNNGCAACFLKTEISQFVKSQISKIGRVGVKISDKIPKNLDISNSFDEKTLTVSSMRLDVIVAALTGLSREKTAELILSGKVCYNYMQTQNLSMKLSDDGILSVRGYGKFIIEKQIGFTKKGRIKLLIKYYR
ncbi:MAG: RNA-binding protein [Ruminococcus sp.]